jgi:hypothetical protein
MHDEPHSNPFASRMARLMLAGAIFVALGLAVDLAWHKAATAYLVPFYVVAFIAVVIGESLSWHNATAMWFERRFGAMMLWMMLGIATSVGTLLTNFSTSANNQDAKAGTQKAAFVTQQDIGNTEAELTKKNNDLLQRISLAPQRGPEAALAAMKRAEADKLWGRTEGCTKNVAGTTTRPFCDGYASAVADLEAGKNLATWKTEQKAIAEDLREVREKRASSGSAVVSEEGGIVLALMSTAKVDAPTARRLDSMFMPTLMQILLIFGSMAVAGEAYRGRRLGKWVEWDRVARFFRKIGSAFSVMIGLVTGAPARPRSTELTKSGLIYEPVRMREVVSEWAGHRTLKVPGKTISTQAAYAHYCQFAHELSVAPVDLITFKDVVGKQLGNPSITLNNEEWFAGVQFRNDVRLLA